MSDEESMVTVGPFHGLIINVGLSMIDQDPAKFGLEEPALDFSAIVASCGHREHARTTELGLVIPMSVAGTLIAALRHQAKRQGCELALQAAVDREEMWAREAPDGGGRAAH